MRRTPAECRGDVEAGQVPAASAVDGGKYSILSTIDFRTLDFSKTSRRILKVQYTVHAEGADKMCPTTERSQIVSRK